jgi:hypothetical protein
MIKIIDDGKEKELKELILNLLTNSSSSGFREVDGLINYISNILEGLSETVEILYEKGILDINDISRITKRENLSVKN